MKFLIEARYTVEGAKGLARDGGTGRRAAITTMVEGLGGKVEAFYYCFGEADCIIIADLPDHAAAAADSSPPTCRRGRYPRAGSALSS